MTVEQHNSRRPLDLPPGTPPLRSLYLYMTAGCNLNCRHCWIAPEFQKVPREKTVIDADDLAKVVQEAIPLGLCQAKLTGGEPTFHPRFRDIAALLSANGLKMDMETNGTLIDKELAQFIKEETLINFVSISPDSVIPEKHDGFRGVDGAFLAAVDGIRNLVSVGLRPQVIMSPFSGNFTEIDAVAELAVKLGASSVKFNPVYPSGRGTGMEKTGEILELDRILEMIRHIRGPLNRRLPIPLLISTPPAISTISELMATGDSGGTCQVRTVMGILGTGEYALCGIGRVIPELCFGKIEHDSLKEIWIDHPTLVKLRKDLGNEYPGICGDCIHQRRCMTHCVAQNYLRSGKLVWPAEICEDLHRLNGFPPTRRISYDPRN